MAFKMPHLPNEIELMPLDSLRPYPTNPRKRGEKEINQLCASITEFGWTQPILIDEANTILAGHGRRQAAIKMQLDQVPCIRLLGLTAAQKKAYVIADNRLPENSEWDLELLAQEVEALQAAEYDLSLLGFEEDELADLLAEEDEQPDQSLGVLQPEYDIIVKCTGEKQQRKLLEEFIERGIKCRALT